MRQDDGIALLAQPFDLGAQIGAGERLGGVVGHGREMALNRPAINP
jgi:hypothetical protein